MTVWAVLAGGRGIRYGQPKASAPHDGGSFLEHCLRVIGEVRGERDETAVSVGFDWTPDVPLDCSVVRDAIPDPGPAHSIGRLAEFARERNTDLVYMAVDMLALSPITLLSLRDRVAACAAAGSARIVVASASGRDHWVLGGIPRTLLDAVVKNAPSVNSVQVLLRLCPLERFNVPIEQLLDVNTPDLRPGAGG